MEIDAGDHEALEAAWTERHAAFGLIVEFAASMEYSLRSCFCALVGSKFAVVLLDGYVSTSKLIAECKALANAHREVPEAAREAIIAALDECARANTQRNELTHSMKMAMSLGAPDIVYLVTKTKGKLKPEQAIRSLVRTDWPVVKIRETALAMGSAGLAARHAVNSALGDKAMSLDQALAWEDRRRQESEVKQ